MSDVYQGLSPHSADWEIKFEKEKELFKKVFGDSAIEIEHIGSTAIDGLPSKPIIDIAVMIKDHAMADAFTESLLGIGYKFHSKSTERHFYQKGEPVEYHVSIAFTDRGGFWPRQIIFRDYLRSHPDARDAYALLKSELMTKYPKGVGEYSAGKTKFVQKILALAGWEDGLTYRDWNSKW